MKRKYLILNSFLFILAGCQSGPAFERPAAELPSVWSSATPPGTALGARWWSLYNDKALDTLVDEALQHNRDLALAVARVDEARALLGVADAQRYPSVDATAQRDRTRASERGPIPLPASAIERNDTRAQINVAYELDLWGRLRNASNAARADYKPAPQPR